MSFTLGGKTPKELGFRVLEDQQDRVLTTTRNRVVEIPEKNGAYDFGADLGEKFFYFPCAFVTEGTDYSSPSAAELQKKVRALAAHLIDSSGKPENLTFSLDRESDKYYTVRYAGDLPIQRIAYQSIGFFTLPLVAYDPAAYAEITEYDEDLNYDDGHEYDTGLIYPNPTLFHFKYAEQFSALYNYGTVSTPLRLDIEGVLSNLTVTNASTDQSFTLTTSNTADKVLVVDSSKYQAYQADTEGETVFVNSVYPALFEDYVSKVNKLNDWSGDWIMLQPGENKLTFEATGPDAQVRFKWKNKFV